MRIVPVAILLAVAVAACTSATPDTPESTTTTTVVAPETTTTRPTPTSFLALGDSYTAGTSIDPADAWPFQLERRLGASGTDVTMTSIADDGWNTKRLHREIARTEVDTYGEILLAIGANDVVLPFGTDNFEEGLALLVQDIEARSGPTTVVTILSIADFRATPWGQERIERGYDIEGYNAILESLAADIGARYVDITTISGAAIDDPSLVAPDDLHFSASMYALWVDILLEAGVGS